MKKIRIGSGAGWTGDRIEPAIELAERGNIQYLSFECMGEKTVANGQQRKMVDPNTGYDVLLVPRFEAVLDVCHKNDVKIITNAGVVNPVAAGKKIKEIAQKAGIKGTEDCHSYWR